MIVVGLTGGIATGKSTVADWFRKTGVAVIDADRIAREVVRVGTPALGAIQRAFGPKVLRDDGELDRPAMRQRIATDPTSRVRLEQITHPAIFEAIENQLQALRDSGAQVAVVEAALMVETGSYRSYDEVIVVTCSPDLQLSRLLARDGADPESSKALIAAQWPLAEKAAVATHIIENNGTIEALHARVQEVWDAINPSSRG